MASAGDYPPCDECGEPGWSYTLFGHSTKWFPGNPTMSPSVNYGSRGPVPRFVRYCKSHALGLRGVAAA